MHTKHGFSLLLAISLSTLALLGQTIPAHASKGEGSVEAKKNEGSTDGTLIQTDSGQSVQFAIIPGNVRTLVLVAESARVLVKRDTGSDIRLKSNCPRNWSVHGSQIRQAGFSGEVRKGSSLLADDLGSRAIVGGQVYLFPPGPMRGIKMGADGVFINGEKVEPLKGSEIPCNCSGEDYLELTVPQSFTGDLKIGSSGKSKINVETWKDGALELTMLQDSSFSAGKLDSLAKAAFDNKGKGSAEIAELDAKIFVASTRGNGNASIKVKKGKAEMSNATVEGNGSIELHGSFKKLQQLVDGQGKIEVKP